MHGDLRTHAGTATSGYRFLAVRWQNRYAIVPLAEIVRIEAHCDRVRIHAGRTYAYRETLTGVCSRLPADTFVRVHRSHVVNVLFVRELRPRTHGEYLLSLADGTTLVSGRACRDVVEKAFGLRQ